MFKANGGYVEAAGDGLSLAELAGGHELRNPERALWAAVIRQAWLDCFVMDDYKLTASENAHSRVVFDPGEARREARRWLMSPADPWAESRAVVCDYAGVHEPTLRALARARAEADSELTEAREQAHADAMRAKLDGRLEEILAGYEAGRFSERSLDTKINHLAKYEAEAF